MAFALAWPTWGLWPLVFVALVPLSAWAIRARSVWAIVLVVLLTQAPAWAAVNWWMARLTPPGFVILSFYCAAYIALFAVVLRRAARSRRFGHWPMAILVPVLFAGTEFLRTRIVLGGYPWYQLGVPLAGGAASDGILAQSASLFGAHWLTFVAASVSGAMLDAIRRRPGWQIVVLSVALFQLLNGAFGWWILKTATTRPGPRILAVQTNLPVSNGSAWTQVDQVRDFRTFLEQTLEGASRARNAGTPPDLIVWPETMVPGFGLEPDAIQVCEDGGYYPGAIYLRALQSLFKETKSPLLVGAAAYLGLRIDGERWAWDKHFNSAYLIDGEPPFQRYDKLVLTPGGEEMPLISRSDWLEEKLLALGAPGMRFDLSAGDSLVRFEVRNSLGGVFRVATPICFEDTVGYLCRRLCYEDGRKVVDVMVNLSNEGWFGSSQPAREQHALHARLRSIELAIPMLRCANTGLSVLIDDRGRITHWIGGAAPGIGNMPGTLLAPVALSDRLTTYGRIGDVWSWTMLAGSVIITLLSGAGAGAGAGA
ncbi:MAG: apolipoprotein N-acyltransferase, partial [Phycisphaerae bacterium]|nr:apolipoprotein N-acyltransferase [Phycisphaerae bacterium]